MVVKANYRCYCQVDREGKGLFAAANWIFIKCQAHKGVISTVFLSIQKCNSAKDAGCSRFQSLQIAYLGFRTSPQTLADIFGTIVTDRSLGTDAAEPNAATLLHSPWECKTSSSSPVSRSGTGKVSATFPATSQAFERLKINVPKIKV